MEPEENGKDAPRLMFSLQVNPVLQRVITPRDPLNEAVHEALVQGLNGLMETLGIPGKPAVGIKALEGPLPGGRFLRVGVEDQVLRYSDEDVQSVYSWLNGSIFRTDVTPPEILAWLNRISELGASESDHQMVATFLSQISVEIIKAQPSVLLGGSQLEAYRTSLPIPSIGESGKWPPDPTWLLPILSEVLRLKISIADKQAVTDTLSQNIARSWPDACEELIDALYPDAIDIHLPEEYMRQLTTIDSDNRAGLLAFLRDGLFAELGVVYPEFRLVPDAQLPPKQFMFKLNHLTCIRQVGLGPEECLVNDTPDRLKQLHISANAAGNPATGTPNSITSLENKNALESDGFTTWDEMGYLILSLAAVLRRSSSCFVHRRFTEGLLNLANTAFPALVKTVRSSLSAERITAVLRTLVSEELSVRNSRLILERLSDYQLREDPGSRVVLDDMSVETGNATVGADLAKLTEFVRAGMKRQISGKYSRETNTMVTYLLDHGIEELLSRTGSAEPDTKLNSGLEEERQDKILESIRQEIATLPPTAQLPLILTNGDARLPLRKAIAQEFPRLKVVAYQELMPGLNVQPVARIS
jgi:flagellar biosynthesis component FlhA